MELRVCSACRQVRAGHTACPTCHGALTLGDERLFVGETFGKYELMSVLGAGGMGIVYRARHRTLQRAAAVKIVVPALAQEEFSRRFLREAQVLAELKHPHIVEVYDFDVSDWGTPYYVMELLQGASLGQLLKASGKPLPPRAVSFILRDVAAALGVAHRRGVVHRDLKPDNLFLASFDGHPVVKVLDFGIAKVVGRDTEASAITATGAVVGTPAYLTPEQLLGLPVTPATDQYALALVAAELLQGRAVRAGRTLGDVIREDIRRPLLLDGLPPDVPAAARDALARATAPEAGARFPDVAAFVQALSLPPADEGLVLLASALTAHHAPAASEASEASEKASEASTGDVGSGATATVLPPSGAGAGTPIPSPTVAVTTGAPVRHARRIWGGLALLAAALVAAGILARARREHPTPPPPATTSLLRLHKQVTVPPDVTGVLGRADDTLVLAGARGYYLLPADGSQPPTRASGDVFVLGATGDGELFTLADNTVSRRVPVSGETTSLLRGLPPALAPSEAGTRTVSVSPSGAWVAVVQADRVLVSATAGGTWKTRVTAPGRSDHGVRIALGERMLVVSEEGRALSAWRLADGTQAWSVPFAERGVGALALLEDAGLVAVGGWFDHVDVRSLDDGGLRTQMRRQGRTNALAWIPDAPTLVADGPDGIVAWRAGDEVATWGRGEHHGDDVLFAGTTLAAVDGTAHTLSLLDYGDLAVAERVALGGRPVWALVTEPGGPGVFAGDAGGTLFAWRPGQAQARATHVHTDGITDLVAAGDHMASASDDRTIAVWQLPALTVQFRGRAHGYLVNEMALVEQPPALWSSSSDGTVKRWGWPQPDEVEALDTQALLGRRYALQALWVDPSHDLVAAGTWDHALAVFRRRKGRWQARTLPAASQTLYRAVGLPGVSAVLLVGLRPAGVYVFDPQADTLLPLRSFGADVYAVAALGPDRAAVAATGIVLRYAFTRGPEGLRYTVWGRARTELGTPLSAALPGADSLVLGTATGDLVRLDPATVAGTPLARDVLAGR